MSTHLPPSIDPLPAGGARRLSGRVAIVTGAASGIGRATAVRLAAEGAFVVVNDLQKQKPELDETIARLEGSDHVAVAGDVNVEDTARRLAAAALAGFGTIDILVNNAAIPFVGDITETSVEDFDRVVGVNLRGMFLCAKHALPPMLAQGRGSIINLGSISAYTGQEVDGQSQWLYNATKAAAVQLSVSLGTRYGADGVRVNAVCPGVTATGMLRASAPDASDAEYAELWDSFARGDTPLNRAAKPEEIAAAIAFLASDDASFVTATSLIVDGGFLGR